MSDEPSTFEEEDREWETGSENLEDAVMRSLADGFEFWETYHAAPDQLRFPAQYFMSTLEERGYKIVPSSAEPDNGVN